MFRRSSLRETMSEYLVKRLEEHPNIEIIPSTDVVALHGEEHLAGLTYRCRETGDGGHCDCGSLFPFLGTRTNTNRLKVVLGKRDGNRQDHCAARIFTKKINRQLILVK